MVRLMRTSSLWSCVPVRTKVRLREAASEHKAMLEQNPQRVIRYFQDRRVRYAA